MNILVTGGAGYIGSHTCVALLQAGHKVVVVDNLSNSTRETIDKVKDITGKELDFYQIDVANEKRLNDVFAHHAFDGVIHFAGFKSVNESIEKPLDYYENNLTSTIVLAKVCERYHVNKFVYSSSATVYGDIKPPCVESMKICSPTNPYGETKAMNERILQDAAKSDPHFMLTLLRYFNPIGAHESGLIGEIPKGVPSNVMPYLTQVAKGKLPTLSIFGSDYPTVDGTGVRDYIHVMDLAEAHVAALLHMKKGVSIYNLGTGHGTSVLQLLKAFQKATGISVPYTLAPRRAGDIAYSYADVSKANQELEWIAKRDITDMCRDAWRFEQRVSGQCK